MAYAFDMIDGEWCLIAKASMGIDQMELLFPTCTVIGW